MPRVRINLTLPGEMIEGLEREAAGFRVSVSKVVEQHVQSDWHHTTDSSELEIKVEQLVRDMGELRARVLPLVERVNVLLQAVEQQGPPPAASTAGPMKVARYSEMYSGERR